MGNAHVSSTPSNNLGARVRGPPKPGRLFCCDSGCKGEASLEVSGIQSESRNPGILCEQLSSPSKGRKDMDASQTGSATAGTDDYWAVGGETASPNQPPVYFNGQPYQNGTPKSFVGSPNMSPNMSPVQINGVPFSNYNQAGPYVHTQPQSPTKRDWSPSPNTTASCPKISSIPEYPLSPNVTSPKSGFHEEADRALLPMQQLRIDENNAMNEKEMVKPTRTTPGLYKKGSLTFDRTTQDPGTFYEFSTEPLGSGTYGQVMTGVHRDTHVRRAIKCVDKNRLKNYVENPSEFVRRELDVLRRLDHPNIVKIFETFEDLRYLYIVLELCEGGDLLSRILSMKHFNERAAAGLLKEILSSVYYMHENQFVHRDLKPDNFLFTYKPDDANGAQQPPLKLIDFGLAKRILRGTLAAPTPHIGTPAYMAPEVHDGNYDEKADVWSVGVILHVLLSGRFPNLNSAPTVELYFAHDGWKDISAQGRQLMCDMLQKNTAARCTAARALAHPWVTTLAHGANPNVCLHSKVISNLSEFMKDTGLKKMALNVVAREMNENDIEDLKQLFRAFDVNGDGMLTFEEMRIGIMKCQDPKQSKAGVDFLKLFEEIDTDGSGSVDYTEFLASSLDRQRYEQEAVLWKAFKTFDVDGSGAISATELQQVLNQESVSKVMKKSKMELDALVKEVDQDGDGEINFDEFINMMRA